MNESTTSSTESDPQEQFWAWLRSSVSISARLIEALGDFSEFSVLRYIETKYIDDGEVLKSFAIKIVPRDVAEAERARRRLPPSPFSDDSKFDERLPAMDKPPLKVEPW
jgi:hypothetical protein